MLTRLVLICVLCLSVMSVSADDSAQANKLLVEAVKSIQAADMKQTATEQLPLLEKALAKLKEIVEKHPSSDLAVKLITGQDIGNVSLTNLQRVTEMLREQVLETRPEAHAHERSIQEETPLRAPVSAGIGAAQAEINPTEQAAIQSYLGSVIQRLESHKRYPRIAERSGLSGRVVLRFTVRRDGEVLNPEVAEVAGHDSFRKAALQALARVGQLPPLPSDISQREIQVEVPVYYSIGNH